MELFPAIDLRGGAAVRLLRGDYKQMTVYSTSPVEVAKSFAAAGARYLHLVDLDGACAGERKNTHIFTEVAEQSGLQVEVGGGIRTLQDIEYYLSRGLSRVVIGSAAVKNPKLVREACKLYGDKIAVGIDARGGFVATEGWVETGTVDYITLAKEMEQAGVRTVIFTDIDRDGMLSGPNLTQLQALNEAVSCNVVASGGIKDIDDIKALCDLHLYGAICGRSIYKGTLDLQEAIALAQAEV